MQKPIRNHNLIVSQYLRLNVAPLSQKIVHTYFEMQPGHRKGLRADFDERLQDAQQHVAYLAEAIAFSSVRLWLDYIEWARVHLKARGNNEDDFAVMLNAMRMMLPKRLRNEERHLLSSFIDESIDQLYGTPLASHTYVNTETTLGLLAGRYLTALLYGNCALASQLVNDALEGGMTTEELYLQVFQPAQYEIGRLWQENKISVAHEHYCTGATARLMSHLTIKNPSVAGTGSSMLAACVEGEQHETGLRMVADFFSINGWETSYLGANTPIRSLLTILEERAPQVLALSVTITTHMSTVSETIRAVRSQPNLLGTQVIVGGYPFNVSPRLWRDIGADGYAPDAARAVDVARELVS